MLENRRSVLDRKLVALVALLAACAFPAAGQVLSRDVVMAGEAFPPGTFSVINAGGGKPSSIDLGQVVGKKPVVFVYWMAGNERSEGLLRDVQALVREAGGDVALYGVAVPRPGRGLEVIRERITAAGIEVPVLEDTAFRLGKQVQVQTVPDIVILDRSGRLRLANGAALGQTLEYKMTLADALRRVAGTGELGTYGYLDRYYPVEELVGQRCPDATAPLVDTSVEKRLHAMLEDDKLNVLIFWSVDCPHCREELPRINDWLRQNGSGVNVVSAARITNPASKEKTQEFCSRNNFVFPTLADREARMAEKFHVTSTPTILIIRPDGVIDSVLLSSHTDFAATIEERKRALLKSAG